MSIRKHQLVTLLALSAGGIGAAMPAAAQSRQRALTYSFHVGSAHPLGAMDSLNDANVHWDIDFSYRLGDRTPTKGHFNAKLFVALNQFTAEPTVTFPHQRWLNISGNFQWVTNCSITGLQCYLQAGGGIYKPKTGPSKAGVNAGFGFQVPVGTSFALEFGADLHQIQTKPSIRFYTVQLGVLFH